MSNIFEWDAQNGSYIARTGQVGIATGSPKFNRTDKGNSILNELSKNLSFNVNAISSDKFTFYTYFYYGYDKGTYCYVGDSSKVYFEIRNDNRAVLLFINNSTIGGIQKTSILQHNKWYFILGTYDGIQSSNKFQLYINAINILGINTGTIPSSIQTNLLLGTGNSSANANNKTLKLGFDSRIYNQKEINDLYINFLNYKPFNPPIVFQPNLSILKLTEVKETGLIVAYNFNPINGKIINVAWDNPANGYNARQYNRTVTKVITDKDSCKYNSLSTTQSINLGDVQTLQYVIKPTILNQILTKLNSSSNVEITSSGGISVTGVSVETVYINGSTSGIISANNWNTISITLSSPLNANDYILGNLNYNGYINDDRIYNYILSIDNIKKYHNSFASKVVLQEDFHQYAVGSTKIGQWQVKSGSFIIVEDSQGKYLKCVTNGVIQIPLKDSDKLITKKYIGAITLSKTSLLTKFIATTGQICRLIQLTQGVEV